MFILQSTVQNQIQSIAENTPWSHFIDTVHGILNLELRAFWDGRFLPVLHQHELYTYPKINLTVLVQLCIKSMASFCHSVLSLIWHKNSHSYGRNGHFCPSFPIFHWPYWKLKLWEGLEQWFSAWAASGNQPGNLQNTDVRSHPRESCLISGNAGYTGRMWWCTKSWEPQAWGLISPRGSQPRLQVRITWKAVAKNKNKNKKTTAPPVKTTFVGDPGSRNFRKLPDDFWCTARG